MVILAQSKVFMSSARRRGQLLKPKALFKACEKGGGKREKQSLEMDGFSMLQYVYCGCLTLEMEGVALWHL